MWCAGVLAMHQPWYSKPSMQTLRRRRLCGGITGLEWLNPSVGILQMGRSSLWTAMMPTAGLVLWGVHWNFYSFQLTFADLEKGQYTGVTCHAKCYKVMQRDLGHMHQFLDV